MKGKCENCGRELSVTSLVGKCLMCIFAAAQAEGIPIVVGGKSAHSPRESLQEQIAKDISKAERALDAAWERGNI